MSATYTFPAASAATPDGLSNRASLPVPSLEPTCPAVPAIVLTAPAAVILRIVLLFLSATYTLPAASIATPYGLSNRASLPVPSLEPTWPAVPANVLTAPAAVILRIVSLSASATYTLPAASIATLLGCPKRAAVPLPSNEPGPPSAPASNAIGP